MNELSSRYLAGLQYKILTAGTGAKLRAPDSVVAHQGTLIDGTEFDSCLQARQPALSTVDNRYQRIDCKLQLMPVGSKWQLLVRPEKLAYGARGPSPTSAAQCRADFESKLPLDQGKEK